MPLIKKNKPNQVILIIATLNKLSTTNNIDLIL